MPLPNLPAADDDGGRVLMLGQLFSLAGVALSLVAFFTFAWLYVTRVLFADHEVTDARALAIFSADFAVCCLMYQLVVFEIVDVGTPGLRWVLWKAALTGQLALLVFVIPWYSAYTTLRSRGLARPAAVRWAAAALLAWLYVFWSIGAPVSVTGGAADYDVFSLALARVGVLGVLVMAVLAGTGAVDAPFQYMARFLTPVDDRDMRSVERNLHHAMDRLVKKRRELALALAKEPAGTPGSAASASGSSSLFGSLSSWAAGVRRPSGVAALRTECRQQSDLCAELFKDVDAMRVERERHKFARTLKGRFYNLLGYGFAAYCLYKIVMALVNIVFDRHAKVDPITRSLELLLAWAGLQLDAAFWSQTASFAMVGVMAISSIRGFLQRLLASISTLASGTQAALIILLVSHVMGMYFVSSVLLMRMSLPAQYRATLTAVLGPDLEFDFFARWQDAVFLPSALVTLLANVIVISASKVGAGARGGQFH